MAAADYRLCDICRNKTFYDSNLNYDFDKRDPQTGEPKLDYLGDWAVICETCAKTHETIVVPKDAPPSAPKAEQLLREARSWIASFINDKSSGQATDTTDNIIARIDAFLRGAE